MSTFHGCLIKTGFTSVVSLVLALTTVTVWGQGQTTKVHCVCDLPSVFRPPNTDCRALCGGGSSQGGGGGARGPSITDPSLHTNMIMNQMSGFLQGLARENEAKAQAARMKRLEQLRREEAIRAAELRRAAEASDIEIGGILDVDGLGGEELDLGIDDGIGDLISPDPVETSAPPKIASNKHSSNCNLSDPLAEARKIHLDINSDVKGMVGDEFKDGMTPEELKKAREYIEKTQEEAEKLKEVMDKLHAEIQECQENGPPGCMDTIHDNVDEENKALLDKLIDENATESLNRVNNARTILDNSLNKLSSLSQKTLTDGINCEAKKQASY